MNFFKRTKEKKFGQEGLPSTIFSFLKTKNSAGFTLIETFVAITILLIAIVGPFTLVMKGLAVSKSTKGQIIAMYLAQDGMEYVRNIRDENILTGDDWLDDLGECVGAGVNCLVDTSYYRRVIGCDGECAVLKLNSSSKIYGYDTVVGWADSIFTREINIDEITPNVEVIVTVKMSWPEGPNLRDFTITEHLLNWQ